jgi:hypothetical protein
VSLRTRLENLEAVATKRHAKEWAAVKWALFFWPENLRAGLPNESERLPALLAWEANQPALQAFRVFNSQMDAFTAWLDVIADGPQGNEPPPPPPVVDGEVLTNYGRTLEALADASPDPELARHYATLSAWLPRVLTAVKGARA